MSFSSLEFIDIGVNLTDLQGYYHGQQKHISDLELVLQRAQQMGVKKIIMTAGCLKDTTDGLELCKKYDPDGNFMYTTIGVHPTRCNELLEDYEGYMEILIQLAKTYPTRIVALGEIGLDFDRTNFCEKEIQLRFFKEQLQTLVPALELPLFLHMRNSCTEFIGVVHSFTGSTEEVEQLLSIGLDIGVNGCSLKTQENLNVIGAIPLDRLHLETDAPWCGLRPTHASWKFVETKFDSVKPEKWSSIKHIKGRNEPCNIIQVAEVVAKMHQIADCSTLSSKKKKMGILANDDIAIQSLPLLQDRIKKDPEAYRDEFNMQFEHFESSLEIFATSPQKPEKSFHELVMFVAHTVPYYTNKVEDLVDILISTLSTHSQTINPLARRTVVNAILLLRAKDSIPLMRLLPLIFELLDLPDKSLRELLLNFIVRDIAKRKLLKQSSGKSKDELQRFLLSQLQDKTESRSKRATRLAIDLYRRDAWRDPRMINALSECCFSPYLKVALAATTFMLGNCTSLIDEEDESGNEKKDQVHAPVGSKQTKGKARKLEREKEAAKRKLMRKDQRQSAVSTFSGSGILDLLHDPLTFAERLLNRVVTNKQKDTLQLKLALLNLISRLIGRYQLIILNFYPLIHRYISPKQKQITQILAIFAQACHELVPPEELHTVMRGIMDQFIVEYQSPEVIAVGLNAVREICQRAPLALTKEMLTDLAEFRTYQHKAVVSAARSLINLYRDIYPELLHRRLRGKKAAIELAEETAPRPEFGQIKVVTGIPGLNMLQKGYDAEVIDNNDVSSEEEMESDDGIDALLSLAESEEEVESNDDEEEESSCDLESCGESSDECEIKDFDRKEVAEEENDVEARPAKKQRLENKGKTTCRKTITIDPTEQLLTDRDFKRIRKSQKRSPSGASISGTLIDELSESSSDSEAEEDQTGDVVRPESLKSRIKKKGRDYRISLMQRGKEGRLTFAERNKERSRLKIGSIPNSAQKRNKPLMMVKQNRMIKQKRLTDAGTKLSNLRKHIKTLKMETGKKRKYRRR